MMATERPDPRQVLAEHQEAIDKAAREKVIDTYRYGVHLKDMAKMLDTIGGRRVLRRILDEYCGVLRNSTVMGDALSTHYNGGRQSVGLTLIEDINQAVKGGYGALLTTEGKDHA